MTVELTLGLIAFLTSSLAAIIGLGGGMLLIGVMPIYLPANIVIPVHGVTQIASNASRAWFALPYVQWHLLPLFLVGSLLGIGFFSLFLVYIPTHFIPVWIGSYILLTLWSKTFKRLIQRYESFFTAGFFQSGLGIVVGATGPLTTTLMANRSDDKDAIIATNALFMLLSHILKIILFGVLGFAFSQHLPLMLCMVVGAISGSWFGTKLRARMSGERFMFALKTALSMLAVYMIGSVLVDSFM